MEPFDVEKELGLLGHNASLLLKKVEDMINYFYESSKQELLGRLADKIISKIDRLKDEMLVQFQAEAAEMKSNLWKEKSNLIRFQQRLGKLNENENGTYTSKDQLDEMKDNISKIRENLSIRLDVKFCKHALEIENCVNLGTVSFVRTPAREVSRQWLCMNGDERNQKENEKANHRVLPETGVNVKSTLPSIHGIGLHKIPSKESSGFIDITGPSNQRCETNIDSKNVEENRMSARAGILKNPARNGRNFKHFYDRPVSEQEPGNQIKKPGRLQTMKDHRVSDACGIRTPRFKAVSHVPSSNRENSKASTLISSHTSNRNVGKGGSYKFLKFNPSAESEIINKRKSTKGSHIETVRNDNIHRIKMVEKELPADRVNLSIGGNSLSKQEGTVHGHFVHDVVPKRSVVKHHGMI